MPGCQTDLTLLLKHSAQKIKPALALPGALPVVEGTDLFQRFANFIHRSAAVGGVPDCKHQTDIFTLGDAKVFFHFRLIIHADHAGGKSEAVRFMAHIHTCRPDISLRETLGIFIVIQYALHHFGVLFHKDDEC